MQWHNGKGLSLLQLLEAGTHGLLCAVEEYDPQSGAGFAEYASDRIEQTVQEALSKEA